MSLTSNILAYWSFDQNSGSTLNDVSGNNISGTWNGTLGSQWTSGKLNNAGNFNGTNNYVDLGTPSSLQGFQTGISFAGWFKQNSTTGTQPIFSMYSATTGGHIPNMIRIDSGTLLYYTNNASNSFQSAGSFTPTVSNWHFFAVTVGGTAGSPALTIYLDGASQTPSLTAIGATASTAARIGGDAAVGSELFNGLIDEFGIWGRVLSPSDVSSLYNNGNGFDPFSSNLSALLDNETPSIIWC